MKHSVHKSSVAAPASVYALAADEAGARRASGTDRRCISPGVGRINFNGARAGKVNCMNPN